VAGPHLPLAEQVPDPLDRSGVGPHRSRKEECANHWKDSLLRKPRDTVGLVLLLALEYEAMWCCWHASQIEKVGSSDCQHHQSPLDDVRIPVTFWYSAPALVFVRAARHA